MSSSHATLSAAADDRKARLAKLRSIKRKQPDDEIVPPESDRASPAIPTAPTDRVEDHEEEEPDVARLHLSGRNYDPEARGVKLGFEAPPNLAAGADTLETKAAGLEADLRRQQQQEEDEEGGGESNKKGNSAIAGNGKGIDLFKLQPKKPNWDLKRELNKRLEPLNARTDNAIARLVRSRLAAKQQSEQKQVQPKTENTNGNGEEALEGAALVESIRLREQETEEEERREREAEDEQ